MKKWIKKPERISVTGAKGADVFALLLLFVLTLTPFQTAHAEDEDGRVPLVIKAIDEGNETFTFTWRQVDGPKVRIAPSTESQITEDGKNKWVSKTYFIPSEAGTYKFEVVVKNKDGIESVGKIAPIVVVPPPPAPVAVAGKDRNVSIGQVVSLNGIDSKVGQGLTIKQWEWKITQAPEKAKKIDPKKLTERQLDFKADVAGVYQFELKVFDGKRWSTPSRLMVTVKPLSLPPKLDLDPTPPNEIVELPPKTDIVPVKQKPVVKAVAPEGGTLKVGETVILDGSASQVDVVLKPEFLWRQESGPKPKLFSMDQTHPFDAARKDVNNYPVWKFIPATAGEYTFILEITTYDDDDKPAIVKSDVVTYQVGGQNHPPVAKIFIERDTVEVGDVVKLDASKSTDADDDKLTYAWGKVPGKRGPKTWSGVDGPTVEFTADEEGDYTVQLSVSDAKSSSTDKGVIHVGPANQPPTITLKPNHEGVIGQYGLMEADVKDAENDTFECKWSSVDTPIPDEFSKGTQLKYKPKKAGSITFKITATDSRGKSSFATTVVTTKVVEKILNRPPTALLDGPKSASVGELVKISGIRSSDPEKRLLTFHWTQEITEGNPKIPTLAPSEKDKYWEFTPTEPGKYIVCLEVNDGELLSEPERFALTVVADNKPPVALITQPESLILPIGKPLLLDASGSTDPENAKLTWRWKKCGGTAQIELTGADKDKCTITATTAGTGEIELIVNDGTQDSAAERIEFTVGKPNHKPIAVITGPATLKLGAFAELTAATSLDEDGDAIKKWVWSQSADGGPAIGLEAPALLKPAIRFKVDKIGSYVLTLKVVDAKGLESDPVTHTIEVKGLNKSPRAVATTEATAPIAIGKEIKLSARGSEDPEKIALIYTWRKVSGPEIDIPSEMGETLLLTPKTAGDYEFELIVSDGENESLPAKVSFAVKTPNTPPIAVISAIVPCAPGEKITLDASGSKDDDHGKVTEWKWKFISGPAEVKFPWRGDLKPTVDVTLSAEGEYVFQLIVFDGKEWSTPVQSTVKTRAPNQAPSAVFSEPKVSTEENVEAVLDGSASIDPDKGPKPLTYTWKQLEGVPKFEIIQDGAKAKITPKKMGKYKFELRVFDGKATSTPAIVDLDVLKAGTLPVAVIHAIHNPVIAAIKGSIVAKEEAETHPTVLILDGSESKLGLANLAKVNPVPPLTYTWKQVGGEDLKRKPQDMREVRIGMRIYNPGKYRFQLIVSDGVNSSTPQVIDVEVKESSDLGPRGGEKGGTLFPPPRDESKLAMANDLTSKPVGADGERQAALTALSELARSSEHDAEKTLVDALSSADAGIQTVAAKALCQRGISSISALIHVLDSGTPTARTKAHWALKELTQENFPANAEHWKKWWTKQQLTPVKK